MTEPDDRAPDARFTLANERTRLAYQRSAIGLMAAAIAVAHFFGDDAMVSSVTGAGGATDDGAATSFVVLRARAARKRPAITTAPAP